MQEVASMPEPEELEARIAMLSALSRLFAAGGENLDQSLFLLEQSYSRWASVVEFGAELNLETFNKDVRTEWKTELTYEFNRLFVGPGSPAAPPYESVYLTNDRLVMQETTLDVRNWYRAENLRTANQSKEPDDFIATELEFAAYLLSRASELYQQNERVQALDYHRKYNAFWREHLGLWLPEFVRALFTHAESTVFKDIGELLVLTVTPISQGGGLS